jgi:outer membrane murein-binding lipoprotein Lpp
MKNVMQTIFASAVVMGTLLTSCSPSSKKVENAENNVTIAAQELEAEKKAYKADLEAYRTKTQELFDTYEKAMDAFRLSIANQKSAV